LATRVSYFEMRLAGILAKEIMEELNFRNKTQVKPRMGGNPAA